MSVPTSHDRYSTQLSQAGNYAHDRESTMSTDSVSLSYKYEDRSSQETEDTKSSGASNTTSAEKRRQARFTARLMKLAAQKKGSSLPSQSPRVSEQILRISTKRLESRLQSTRRLTFGAEDRESYKQPPRPSSVVEGHDAIVGIRYPRKFQLSTRVHDAWRRRYDHLLEEELRGTHADYKVMTDKAENGMCKMRDDDFRVLFSLDLSSEKDNMQMEQKATTILKGQHQMVPDHSQSKWDTIRALMTKGYFREQDAKIKKANARKQFRRGINSVILRIKFKRALIRNEFSMRIMLSELNDIEVQDGRPFRDPGLEAMRVKFDPSNYKSELHKSSQCITMSSILTMTKSSSDRSNAEIAEAIKSLYPILIHNHYPIKIVIQLAQVGWYIRLHKHRPVIRYGKRPMAFVVVLSGQIVITKPVKGHVDPEDHQIMKFIKYVDHGERFGDEEMDVLNRKRLYSAHTTTATEILYVDYDEYQQNISKYDTEREPAPQHIAYISRLPLFCTIPVEDMIDAAAVDILLWYFHENVVVAKSLKKSDFIFVVTQGGCHTAIAEEVSQYPPHVSTRNSTDSSRSTVVQNRPKGMYGWSTGQLSQLRNVLLEKPASIGSRSMRRRLRDTEAVKNCSFVKSSLAEDFVENIKKISKDSRTHSKEDTVKRIETLPLMRAIENVYGNDCTQQVSADLVEKMNRHEAANRNYEEELSILKVKSMKLKRKLFRVTKQGESVELMKSIIRQRELLNQGDSADSGVPTTTVTSGVSPSRTGQLSALDTGASTQIPKRQTTDSRHLPSRNTFAANVNGPADEEETRKRKEKSKVLFNAASESVEITNDGASVNKENIAHHDRHVELEGATSATPTSTYASPSRKSQFSTFNTGASTQIPKGRTMDSRSLPSRTAFARSANDPIELKESRSKEASNALYNISSESNNIGDVEHVELEGATSAASTLTHASLPASLQNRYSASDIGDSSAPARSESDTNSFFDDFELDRPCTPDIEYPKTVTSFSKGDLIGNEYIDYNDGRYRPPASDFGLISDGVEVVMVSKKFLLQYLYNSPENAEEIIAMERQTIV